MTSGIGILDSGVGGLTVAKEVMRQLPHEAIIYIGDSARCPYGPRPPHQIRTFTLQMVHFLTQFDLKALVIACNTATAVVLDEIRTMLDIPVIGVIEPGSRAAIRATRSGRIGVIGTVGTIRSGMYEKVLRRYRPDLHIVSLACPDFVPLVEAGNTNGPEALQVVRDTLKPLQTEKIDTLILGCTHYPLISHLIQTVMGDQVKLISSAEETAQEIGAILAEGNLMEPSGPPVHRFFTTGRVEAFQGIAESWLGMPVEVEPVVLDPAQLASIQKAT